MPEMEKLLASLGHAISARRISHSLSQQELASAAGIHRSYMSDVERGQRNITLSTLEHIAAGLKTTSAELLATAYDISEKNEHASKGSTA